MLILILAIVIALVAWSLHLMQQAVDRREFSLMLAGTLVAFSAAAMVGVYFLMGSYLGYVSQLSQYSTSEISTSELSVWEFRSADADQLRVPSAIQSTTWFSNLQ